MDGREGNDYAAKVSLSGLGKGSSLAARNLGKSRLGAGQWEVLEQGK